MDISIIIPCFNVEKYIKRCLNSILSQTIGIDRLEIILINDASTDNTIGIIEEFEKEYSSNTIVVNCQSNVGAANARNIGMEYASGKYITFIDADDYVASDMILKLYEKIVEYDADMSECDYLLVNSEVEETAADDNFVFYDFSKPEQRKEYIIKNGIRSAVWGRLYKREFLHTVNALFIPNLYFEDVTFSGKLMLEYGKVVCLHSKMYFYFENNQGLIASVNFEKARGAVEAIRELLREVLSSDKLVEIMHQFYSEFEYYCILKSYLDPVRQIMNQKSDERDKEIIFFKDKLLEIFPKAQKNVYLHEKSNKSELIRLMSSFLYVPSCVTVKILGGLGNQMFCYAYGRMIADYLSASLSLDVTDYYYGYFRRYLLDFFDLADCTRIWYKLEAPKYAENICLPEDLKNKYDLILNVDEFENIEDILEKVKNHRNIYIFGYGGVHLLDERILSRLRNEFKTQIRNYFYNTFVAEIAGRNSVSVHIRRTDFLSLKWNDDKNGRFYTAAMNYIRQTVDNPIFYIFSDDTEWIKQEYGKYEDCICVDSNGGELQSLFDMLAMSKCKFHIITRKSTFGKWASLLCDYEKSFTICNAEDDITSNEFKYINMIYLNENEINSLCEKNCLCCDNFFERISDEELERIQELIINGKNEDALRLISKCELSKRMVNSSKAIHVFQRLCEQKSIAYMQMDMPEMAYDSLNAYYSAKGKVNYDFLYNCAVNEIMLGKKVFSLCFGATAKAECDASDVDELLHFENENDIEIYNIFYRAAAQIKNKVKIIMMTAYCPSSINKYFVSVGMLLKRIGYDVFVWTLGTDNADLLKEQMTSNCILVSNFAEICIKSSAIPLIFFEPICQSDVDRFYFQKYEAAELDTIAQNSRITITPKYINLNSSCSTNKKILDWDCFVNDDEVVFGATTLLDAISQTFQL